MSAISRPRRAAWPPTLTLAARQMRQMGDLLLLLALSLLVSVALTGVLPQYTRVATSAELAQSLRGAPNDLTISVALDGINVGVDAFHSADGTVEGYLHRDAPSYLAGAARTVVELPNLDLARRTPAGQTSVTGDTLALVGTPLGDAAPPLRVVAGRLPASGGTTLEVALQDDVASALGVGVGATLFARYSVTPHDFYVPIQVVGLVQPQNLTDPFWLRYSLETDVTPQIRVVHALADLPTMLGVFDRLNGQNAANGNYTNVFMTLQWLFSIDPARITLARLDDAITQFGVLSIDAPDEQQFGGAAGNVRVTGALLGGDTLLTRFRDQSAAAQIPLTLLLLGLLAVVIVFASVLASLLIERQADAIGLLRSRGFSQRQIFAVVVLPVALVAVVALGLGLALSALVVHLLTGAQFAARDVATVGSAPLGLTLGYGVATVLAALVAVVVAVLRSGDSILQVRRQTGRGGAPLWQRLRLDGVAALLCVLSVGAAWYLKTTVAGINPQIDALLVPVLVVAPVLVLVAALLVALRGVGVALGVATRLASRARGAMALLALARQARAPQHALRLTLLLVVATIYTLFMLTFTAAQVGRVPDVAAFNAGADFSGTVPQPVTGGAVTAEGPYRALAGVAAVAAGAVNPVQSANAAIAVPFTLFAVDAGAYAQTLTWPNTAGQTARAALGQMEAARASVGPDGIVPALVNATTWDALRLSPGATFALQNQGIAQAGTTRFRAIARVADMPQVAVGQGGVLVDYASYVAAVHTGRDLGLQVPLNTLWLRTSGDAAALTTIRAALNTGPLALTNLNDRRALIAALQHDPFYLTLTGTAWFSIGLALALALAGSIIAALVYVRGAVTGFAALRALGATPRQVARILLWEQGVIIGLALLLGFILGIPLALTLVPNLVYTNATTAATPTTAAYFTLQHQPTLRVGIPPTVGSVALGLVALGLLELGILARATTRAAIGQSLRLNDD